MIHPCFIADKEAEVARLIEQERIIASVFGGLLPEHADQAAFVDPFQRVLDFACGSGGWAIHMAQTYPHLQIIGTDLDANMIDYATSLAQAGRLENASFAVMDTLIPLDFPDHCFDLVNANVFSSSVASNLWCPILTELYRVTRPGGFIRLMETEDLGLTTSPAFERMTALFLRSLQLVGFSPGLSRRLPSLLQHVGFQQMKERAFVLNWSAGSPVHQAMTNNLLLFYKQAQPLLIGTDDVLEEDFEQLHRAMQIELYDPDFSAFWNFSVFSAQKSSH